MIPIGGCASIDLSRYVGGLWRRRHCYQFSGDQFVLVCSHDITVKGIDVSPFLLQVSLLFSCNVNNMWFEFLMKLISAEREQVFSLLFGNVTQK